jgi:hypothetical protein
MFCGYSLSQVLFLLGIGTRVEPDQTGNSAFILLLCLSKLSDAVAVGSGSANLLGGFLLDDGLLSGLFYAQLILPECFNEAVRWQFTPAVISIQNQI